MRVGERERERVERGVIFFLFRETRESKREREKKKEKTQLKTFSACFFLLSSLRFSAVLPSRFEREREAAFVPSIALSKAQALQQKQQQQGAKEQTRSKTIHKMTDTEMAGADGEPASTTTAPVAEEEKQDFKLELADKVSV